MAPPSPKALLPVNMEFSIYTSLMEYIAPPSSSSALLLLKVEFMIVSGFTPWLYIAPP